MPWEDLQEGILEEFGAHRQSYDGDNLWIEQAEAARDYGRGKMARIRQDKAAFGRCSQCPEPAAPGATRCAAHLAQQAVAAAKAYERRRAAERAAKEQAAAVEKEIAARASHGKAREERQPAAKQLAESARPDPAKRALAQAAAARRASWPERKKQAIAARVAGFRRHLEEMRNERSEA